MFCSVCLVAKNVIVCYFWFCVCYESVWMMRKYRKCRREGETEKNHAYGALTISAKMLSHQVFVMFHAT